MKTLKIATIALVAAVGIPSFALAQHVDIMVQDLDDRLTHGNADYTNNQWTLGNRTYSDDFDSNFDINDPGWTILGAGNPNMPAGAEGLTPNDDLNFDFLPMKIDGYASNFMYWDGVGSVDFGATPTANYIFGFENFFGPGLSTIDGSPVLELGETVFRTDGLGAIHQHRDWQVDDGVSGTNPVDGIYLVAMRNHMSILDRSKPFYMVFGTQFSSTAARLAAVAWVNTQLDELAPDYSADFNGDLTVGSADLADWIAGYGTTGSAALQIAGDANFDDSVDGTDFLELQRQFGSNLSSFGGASSALVAAINAVPEPGTLITVMIACGAFATRRRLLR